VRRVLVVLGWQSRTSAGARFDLDACAIACGDDLRVLSDRHFVFYNNATSPEGTIVHSGDGTTGGEELISVDLAAMPDTITHVYFPVSIYDENAEGLTFRQVRNAYIQVVDADANVEIARFDLSQDASSVTAMVFGELYRRGGEWRFRAVGQGYASGLAGIASDYGVSV
jgi:tellurium resistance protein TerD